MENVFLLKLDFVFHQIGFDFLIVGKKLKVYLVEAFIFNPIEIFV